MLPAGQTLQMSNIPEMQPYRTAPVTYTISVLSKPGYLPVKCLASARGQELDQMWTREMRQGRVDFPL